MGMRIPFQTRFSPPLSPSTNLMVSVSPPSSQLPLRYPKQQFAPKPLRFCAASVSKPQPQQNPEEEEEEQRAKEAPHANDPGVKVALSLLHFYKREISPLLPRSCRYVPTCSEYSMEAFKKYGFAKGTILTAWRICRCNPLGGSGFDPPRWFGEEREAPSSDL